MTDTTSTKPETFGDIISIVENRARIVGAVQDRDRNFIKGAINEWYNTISTERNWYWRKFDRDFVFARATTTGTVSVTLDSRAVVFTGLTADATYVGRSIKIDGTSELYRIVGVDTSVNTVYLSTSYVGATSALATFKLYQYEFPLPPDCDTVIQVYHDSPDRFYARGSPDLEVLNSLEFNRLLSSSNDYSGSPTHYTKEGKISAETLPTLDVQILDYDFLGGNEYEAIDRIRLFPIEPDQKRLIHVNYTIQVEPLIEDADKPLIPIDNRWILVHFALGEWWKSNGALNLSDREFGQGKKMLNEMRSEHHKTDTKPKFIVPKNRYRRQNYFSDREYLFRISRALEDT